MVAMLAAALVLSIAPSTTAGAAGLSETVLVPSAHRTGNSTVNSLVAGRSYLFKITGSFSYGRIGSGVGRADAECSNLPPDETFQRNRQALLEPGGDPLDVYVNGANIEWEAVSADSFGCSRDHTYTYTYVPTVTAPAHFAVHERNNTDNAGPLYVTVTEIVETPVETMRVYATAANGTASTTVLSPTKLYRIEISGTYTFQRTGSVNVAIADAECMSLNGGPGSRDASGVLTPTNTADDVLDVLVNNTSVDWVPTVPSKLNCNDTNHAYRVNYRPPTASTVRLRVNDNNTADNAGILDVRIVEIPDVVVATGALPLPEISLNEDVTVPANNRNGGSSRLPLQAGESYLLEARGVYNYGGGSADAECSSSRTDPLYLPDRYAAVAPTTDLLDVLVNNEAVEWVPTKGNPDGCNETDHAYRYTFVAGATGAVNFRVNDGNLGDNSGSVTVRIYRIQEVSLGSNAVPANSSAGVNTAPVVAGRDYRFHVSGTYTYAFQAGADADAECSRTAADPVYLPQRYNFSGADVLDLYVNNAPVTWSPATGGVGTCDTAHEYGLSYQPVIPGPVNLKIRDGGYTDNTGGLTATLFMKV